jgi:hypothetical protein
MVSDSEAAWIPRDSICPEVTISYIRRYEKPPYRPQACELTG